MAAEKPVSPVNLQNLRNIHDLGLDARNQGAMASSADGHAGGKSLDQLGNIHPINLVSSVRSRGDIPQEIQVIPFRLNEKGSPSSPLRDIG